MSAIRYFDEVPHIVRYGMQDHDEEKSWVLFWRNGVGFTINAAHDDVRGTPFAGPWLEYVTKPHSIDGSSDFKDWGRRWESHCDFMISACLPILKELAPSSKQWVTLDDYLHTPTYQLKMVTDSATKDAAPEITEGPVDKPAYEAWPTAAANIEHLPKDAPRHHAKDLFVLDQSKDWRCPPCKVQTSDGRLFFFKPCKKTSQWMPEGTFSNHAINAISVYSRLFGQVPAGIRIAQLEGIAVTAPSVDIADSSPSVDWSKELERVHQTQQHTDKELVAGILMTYIAHSQSLHDLLKADGDKPSSDQKDKWKKQITEAVEYLHGLSVTIGGHEGNAEINTSTWYYINDFTVRVADGDAWLITDLRTFHDTEGQDAAAAQSKFEEGRAMDFKGIEKTFDF